MQQFTKHTIRTEGGEYRDEALRIASGWFNAFNVIEGTGYWKGEREESLLIEVIDTPDAPETLLSDASRPVRRVVESYVAACALAISEANDQDAVLIDSHPVNVRVI